MHVCLGEDSNGVETKVDTCLCREKRACVAYSAQFED